MARKAAGKAGKRPYEGVRAELLKLRQEIEEDLKADRIGQADYDLCKRRIDAELRRLDRPLPAGETIRIVGIPKKVIDLEQLARVFLMAAEDQLRKKNGEAPLTSAERRDREATMALASQQARQHRRKRVDAS